MADVEALRRLVYAAVGQSNWSPFLARVSDEFGAGRVSLAPLLPNAASGPPAFFGWTGEEIREYQSRFAEVDIFMQRLNALPPTTPAGFRDVLTQEERTHSDIARNYWGRRGMGDALAIILQSAAPRMIFAFVRNEEAPPFASEEYEVVSNLAPHILQATVLDQRLRSAAIATDAYRRALDVVLLPAFILAGPRKVVDMNAPAADLLRTRSLLKHNEPAGLVCDTPENTECLRLAYDRVNSGGAEQASAVLHHKETGAPFTIVMVRGNAQPLSIDIAWQHPRYTVLFVLPHAPQPLHVPERHLMQVFGLTAREARAGSLLVAGADVGSIAADMHISRDGVRYHLKQLFSKTGTRGQVELVALITANLGPLARVLA